MKKNILLVISFLASFSSSAEHQLEAKKDQTKGGRSEVSGEIQNFKECMENVGDAAYCLAIFPKSADFDAAKVLEPSQHFNQFEDFLGKGTILAGTCVPADEKIDETPITLVGKTETFSFFTGNFDFSKFDGEISSIEDRPLVTMKQKKFNDTVDYTLTQKINDKEFQVRLRFLPEPGSQPWPIQGKYVMEVSELKDGKATVQKYCEAREAKPKNLEEWEAQGEARMGWQSVEKNPSMKATNSILTLAAKSKNGRHFILKAGGMGAADAYEFEAQKPLVDTPELRVWEGEGIPIGNSHPNPSTIMYVEKGNPTTERTFLIGTNRRPGGHMLGFDFKPEDDSYWMQVITNNKGKIGNSTLGIIQRQSDGMVLTQMREGYGESPFSIKQKTDIKLDDVDGLRRFENEDLEIMRRIAPTFHARLMAKKAPPTAEQIQSDIQVLEKKKAETSASFAKQLEEIQASIDRLKAKLVP